MLFVCSGVYLFGVVGLFDGWFCIIYWCYVVDFVYCFLIVWFDFDVFFVDDGDFVISVGIVVGIDVCLYFVCCEVGSVVVIVIVCWMVVFL